MIVTQTLASGLVVRQDFRGAVRPVFFQTEFDDFLYATHGGTLFVVQFRDKMYALTCGHVFKDFPHSRLFIANERVAQKGSKPAPVGGICYPSSPRDGAEGTDIVDVCLIEFTDDLPPAFFRDAPYVVDEKTITTAVLDHELLVAGVLKDRTRLVPPDIAFPYCNLKLRDAGPAPFDPFLRQAFAVFGEALLGTANFETITGLSGAPVFDQTANALCGMVVRGGMTGPVCRLYYLDASDLLRLLQAVYDRADSTYYTKHVPVSPPPGAMS
jgi:hypothetical protein